ncbi:hypothetical protein J7E97_06610 [Streptomyces sp. ISL-66]|uniref:DUF6585 family protein n=1 Tax=Streptomyces sp. ISL-66 TaxID=2819186 RepID=UPI001BEB301D|nr:DUF6585 family protein [Streptomyces sp. ISL-66]MBT2467548.1 hypothetical protein [Streptomyces sp. ISL-66]
MATAAAPSVQEQIPDDVASLATAQGLGLHRETFLPNRLGAWRMAGLFLFAILGLACFVLPGLMFVWFLARSPNLSRKQAAKRIHLFEEGLIVADGTGPLSAFRWDSMTVLQQITERYANGIHVGTTYLYTLLGQDGSAVKLTNFYADPERWGAAIQHGITRAQLPGVIIALEQGATLTFGDISMTMGGIATPRRGGAHWDEIEKIEVKDGTVFVAKAGKLLAWSNTPVAKIPNFFLFVSVVDRLRDGQRHPGN